MRLPIRDVAGEAAWSYWSLWRELLSVMIIPFAGFLAVNIGASLLGTDSTVASWIYWACYVIVGAVAAVSCHRVLLLGPVSVPKFGVNHLGARERTFIAAALFVGFVAGLLKLSSDFALTSLLGLIDPENAPRYLTVKVVASLCAAYLFARLALMLPAIAIDRRVGLRETWQLSNGNGWRLTLLIVLLPWLVKVLAWFLATIMSGGIASIIVNTTLYSLFLPLEIALLSVSYRRLTE